MKVLHISDTHNKHGQLQDLPAADVLVYSGDFTLSGTENEVMDFMKWFCDLPYKHKVVIAGNHDNSLFGADLSGLPDNCHYLYDNGVTIEGIRFFGIPMFVEDDISGNYVEMFGNIPYNTDVLITHQPPYGILDESSNIHYGSKALAAAVKNIKPMAHLFGHIHVANGLYQNGKVLYSNAAMVGEDYEICHNPHIIEI